MRILLLSDSIPPEGKGGAESVVWRLARGLHSAGHEAHLVAATPKSAFEETRDGIATYHIQARYPERFRAWLSLWNPQTARAFNQLLRRLQPDVVNAHNMHYLLSYHCLRQARAAGCGVVFSAHDAMSFAYGKLPAAFSGHDPASPAPGKHRLPRGYNLRQNRFRYNPARNWIIRRVLARQAHIRTAPSHALADAFADNEMPPVEVVHNGIDPDAWRPADDAVVRQLRGRLGLDGKRVILIAGRLTREKGMNAMLRALDRLRETLPEARLLVLSSRDIDAWLTGEFAHLRPLIHLGGWLAGDELRAAYQLADVLALPSIYLDPFPTVVLEAMALGRPVVATCFGGAREAVIDGETGFIVNPFDDAAFSDRLSRVLDDGALRRRMGRAGRERVAARFSLARQTARMIELYERAIQMAEGRKR